MVLGCKCKSNIILIYLFWKARANAGVNNKNKVQRGSSLSGGMP